MARTVDVDHLSVRVLDGRVIALDPYILDELSGQARLADTTSTKDNDVVLASVIV